MAKAATITVSPSEEMGHTIKEVEQDLKRAQQARVALEGLPQVEGLDLDDPKDRMIAELVERLRQASSHGRAPEGITFPFIPLAPKLEDAPMAHEVIDPETGSPKRGVWFRTVRGNLQFDLP